MLAAGSDTVGALDGLNNAEGPVVAPDVQSAIASAMAQAQATAGKSADVVESMKWLAVAFPQGAESVRSLVLHLQKMRSQNRLMSFDLLAAAEGLEADTRMAFGLLQVAIESTLAADAAARDGEAIWGGDRRSGDKRSRRHGAFVARNPRSGFRHRPACDATATRKAGLSPPYASRAIRLPRS